MASPRQVEANRSNAKRSSGPKTKSGKSRSRMNAVKHGLTTNGILIPGEDPREFEALCAELEAEFAPAGAVKRELVNDLAALLWRLRRARSFEAHLIRALRLEIIEAEKKKQPDEAQRYSLQKLAYILMRLPGFRMPGDGRKVFFDWDSLVALSREELGILKNFLIGLMESQGILNGVATGSKAPGEDKPTPQPDQSTLDRLASAFNEHVQEEHGTLYTGQALIRDSEHHDALGKLIRYENSCRNAIARTLNQLFLLQSAHGAQSVSSRL